MSTISALQTGLKQFNTVASRASSIRELQDAWKSIFNANLSNASAKSFLQYYREMPSHSHSHSRKKMHGGNIYAPAPLQYNMVPGVLNQFPVPMHTSIGGYSADTSVDPAYIRDLDVFFANSLTKDCGVANPGLNVPADMGSNKVVGGARSRRHYRHKRKGAKTIKRRGRGRDHSRRSRRSRTWKHRGGNLIDSLAMRPVISTAPPNYAQSVYASATGSTEQVPFPGNPTIAAYPQFSGGLGGLISPGLVTGIGSDMTTMARPAVWQTTN